MRTVDDILTDVLNREGWPKITNRAADKGGLTRGGVTFRSYNAWRKQSGLATIEPSEFEATLTEEEARRFMLESIAGPLLPVQFISLDLFDLLVDWAETSGPDDPTRALQRAIRDLKYNLTINVDGEFGPKTTAALHLLTTEQLDVVRGVVAKARVEFYIDIVYADRAVMRFRQENPSTQLENMRGWVRRALGYL